MTTLYQLILHLTEAFHDKFVIAGSDKSETVNNKRWHLWDSIFAVLLHSGIAVLSHNWIYLFTGLFIRLWVLQVVLNKLRGHNADYLGKGSIDGFCFRVFGERWTLILKSIIFVLCLIYGWI